MALYAACTIFKHKVRRCKLRSRSQTQYETGEQGRNTASFTLCNKDIHICSVALKESVYIYNRCCCILLCFPGKHSTFFTQIVVMQTCACIIGAIRAILVSNPRAKRFQITPELPSNRRRVLAPLWPTQRRAFLPETSDNPWRMVRMKSPAWFRIIAQPPPTKQPSGKHEAAGIWKLDVSVTADFQIFPV